MSQYGEGGRFITVFVWLLITEGEGGDAVGSVSGGGRYDGLVGMFSPKGKVG